MTTLQWTAYFHALLTLKHNFAFRENSLTLANLTSLVWLTLLPASAEAVDADTGPTKRIEKFIIPELINNYEHNATLEQVPPPDYDKQLSNMKARAIKMYFESLFGIYQVPVLENTASEAERQAHRHRTSPYFTLLYEWHLRFGRPRRYFTGREPSHHYCKLLGIHD